MSPLIMLGALYFLSKKGSSIPQWPTPAAPPPPAPPRPPTAKMIPRPPNQVRPVVRAAAPPPPNRVQPVTRSDVRSPTRTEVRSPTRTSTHANTRGNRTKTSTDTASHNRTTNNYFGVRPTRKPRPTPGPFVQPVPATAHPAAAATFPEPVRPMTPAAVPTGPVNVPISEAQAILVALGYEKDLGPAGVDGQIAGLFGPYTRNAWAKAASVKNLDPRFARVGPQTASVEASTYYLLERAAQSQQSA